MIYKQRASSLGKIMTQPRTKKDREAGLLSATGQTTVKDWYKEKLYGRKKNIYSKYLDKGTGKEQDNLVFAADQIGLGLITDTNKQYFEDDYFVGTPDLVLPEKDLIVDIKSSWDFSTFPLFIGEGNDSGYYWQMQCYMHLTGMKKGKLVYVLGNTPKKLVDREIYYKLKEAEDLGVSLTEEQEKEVAQSIRDYHNYDKFEPALRIKVIEYEYSSDDMELAIKQVEKANNYLKSILI